MRTLLHRLAVGLPLAAGLSVLLAACGGGGGGDIAGVGTGGTGTISSTVSVGPISGFGSIIVAGVRFDDTTATVTDEDGTVRSRDDLKLGMKTSAITLGRWDVAAIVGFYLLHTALMAYVLLDAFLSIKNGFQAEKSAWAAIFSIVFLAVLGQIYWHWRLIRGRERSSCFRAFTQNHWLGLCWFVAVVLLSLV